MIRTFSFAAALLIALSSFAFAGTGSPSNGAFPQTHKHHSQEKEEISTSAVRTRRVGRRQNSRVGGSASRVCCVGVICRTGTSHAISAEAAFAAAEGYCVFSSHARAAKCRFRAANATGMS